jgi:O-antigen biosynthesis protein WbqP
MGQFQLIRKIMIGNVMKRFFDVLVVMPTLILFLIPAVLVALMVRLTSNGPIIFWSDRIGKNNKIFKMPKFRTMKCNAPIVATHLMAQTDQYLTPIGSFLRRTSLDELPQLWSIINGDMSFVGPRPALFNQEDLIRLRIQYGVHNLIPGLTGWAQINGRDEIPISLKVELDVEYMKRQSIGFDIYILWLTLLKVVQCEGISH